MRSPRRPLRRRLLDRAVSALDLAVAPGGAVVLHSSPDLDDSTVALLRGVPADIATIVLAESAGTARARAAALGLDVKVLPRRSRRGLLAYLRAPVTITTHGLFGTRPRRRGKKVVGIWHGEFGKLIGSFVGERPRPFDWVPVSSPLARQVRSAEFALDPAHIHVVGAPRTELLRDTGRVRHLLGAQGPVVVVAPTYREAVRGMARRDGDPAVLDAQAPWTWPELDAVLARHGAQLWLRPHPSAEQSASVGDRVRLARDADLEQLGLTFYELLGSADLLVTDYSSLWVDHLVCDVPVLGFCPDLASYRATRGLALEPYEEWFPGPLVAEGSALVRAIDRVLAGHDEHAQQRARVRRLLQDPAASSPVAATWQAVSGWMPRRP